MTRPVAYRRHASPAVALLALALAVPAGCIRGDGPTPAGGPTPPAATGAAAPASPTGAATTGPARPTAPGTARPAPPTRSATPTGLPAALRGVDLTRIPTSRRVVALTFDAGANADAVPSILATLGRERVTATFFLTGDFVTGFPAAARSIVSAGHRLGNHSVSHPHFPALSGAQQRAEVLGAERSMREATGADPRPLFRFPYGGRDAATIATVNGLGYVAVRWTVDSLGWQGLASQTAARVTERVLATAQPGQIVLMHVGSHPQDRSTLDADALPEVIAGLRRQGYGFVTLDVLLQPAGG
ncbi:MAG TPA: polysaccharide deacetylase family protein [Micromonosporaceae bacterium]|nr:polysaccharide deacetylase family protein [Micromonosporaceae bacterium]